MRGTRLTLVWIAVGTVALIAAPAAAAEEPGWSYRLAHDLMSPFCPGQALAECPSPNAAQLREWIIEQERAGVSRDVVEELLFERFGDGLLQAPRAEGLGLVAYAIPIGAGLLGAVVVAAVIARRRAGQQAERVAPAQARGAAPAPLETDPLARQIDAEIGD